MASSKACSSWVLSLLALMAIFNGGVLANLCFSPKSGSLTTFNRQQNKVNLPCKYRLADMTCGDFRVKVTPGNALDADNNYSPVTMWVKVTDTVTMETVKLRTSQRLLEKVEAGELDNPWKIKDGSGSFLTFNPYDGEKDFTSYVEIGNSSISLQFGKGYVYLHCFLPDFSSPGLPETLCGDGVTANELETAKTAAFGDRNLTVTEYLQYIVLNDTTVTQSKTCVAMASDFQGCEKKYEAHIACNKYFNDRELVRCLVEQGTPPEDAYDYCLRKVCYGDDSNKPDLGNCE